VSVWIPVEFVNEGTREIDLLRVCHGKGYNRANFRVKGGIMSRGRLLVGRLLRLWGLLLLLLLWGRGRGQGVVLQLLLGGRDLGGSMLWRW